MFGLVGSGRTEVAKAIFGAEPADRGAIRVDGRAASIADTGSGDRRGIAFVTEDRKRDGLALDLSVLDNGGLASMGRVSRRGVLDRRRQDGWSAQRSTSCRSARRGPVAPRGSSRGGNQQKVVLAKWLLVDGVRVFILDEPTRGVDIGTKVEIYRMIAGLAAGGMAVLLISSEMPEVIGMADRILVMRAGPDQRRARPPASLTMEPLFTHAAGERPAAAA